MTKAKAENSNSVPSTASTPDLPEVEQFPIGGRIYQIIHVYGKSEKNLQTKEVIARGYAALCKSEDMGKKTAEFLSNNRQDLPITGKYENYILLFPLEIPPLKGIDPDTEAKNDKGFVRVIELRNWPCLIRIPDKDDWGENYVLVRRVGFTLSSGEQK